MTEAGEVSIGEFARLSRLSPKALRLYDRAGLLEPVRLDAGTGSRYYRREQLERAHLVASLRQVGIPLSEIRSALDEGTLGADRIAAFWAEAEAEHAARRRLVSSLIERLRGNEGATSIGLRGGAAHPAGPQRTDPDEARPRGRSDDRARGVRRRLPRGRVAQLGGALGAPFTVYYGEVSTDSDGPIEWCWPVAEQDAERLAAQFPDLTLRTDPAHQEAYVHYGATTQLHAARIALAAQSLLAWAGDQDRRTSGGMRLIYLSPGNGSGTDCDVAVPLLRKGARASAGDAPPARAGVALR